MGSVLTFPIQHIPDNPERLPYRQRPSFRAKIAEHAGKRRSAQLSRMPPWADEDAIRDVYREAAKRSRATGVEHHVDHYYPLQGVRVSGLHVAANLRVMPATENIAKSNDMPDDPECWPRQPA